MTIKNIIISLSLLLLTTASADLKTDIAKCSEENNSVTRLSCFDDASKNAGLKRKPEAKKTKSKWVIQIDESKIDDSKTVILFLEANDRISDQFNQKSYPSMILRCENNKTNAYIPTGMFLGTDSIRVTSRLGKNKAKKKNWSISTDNKALFARKPIGFIKNLMKHETLLLEFVPYGESRRLIEFDIAGLSEEIKPLRKTCGW